MEDRHEQTRPIAAKLLAAEKGPTHIKLCGMSRPQDIEAINKAEPELCGFILGYPSSRRNISSGRLEELVTRLKATICAVGVFVNQDPSFVANLANETIDVIQLHGDEDDAYIALLRKLTAAPIIKAFRIRSQEDLQQAKTSSADMVLLDSGRGSGQAFDWSELHSMNRPYLLAGGLRPENIEEAISELDPWGLDMSSGIETNGVKDPDKIKAAVFAVRGAHK